MGFTQPDQPMTAATPAMPEPPEARPAAATPNAKPTRKATQPTFLGTGSTPQAPVNVGGKSLLGQ